MPYTMSYAMLEDNGISYKIFKNGVGIELTEEEMKGILKGFECNEKKNLLIKKENIFNAAISENCEITIDGKVYIIDELTVENNCVVHTFEEVVSCGRCEIRSVLLDKQRARKHTVAFLAVPAKEGYFRVLFQSQNMPI